MKRADWDQINRLIVESNLVDLITSSKSVDDAVSSFTSTITGIIDEHVPRKTVRLNQRKLWMTADLLKIIRAKNEAFKNWTTIKKVGPMDGSMEDFLRRLGLARMRFIGLLKQCRRLIPKAKNEFVSNSFSNCKTSGEFWTNFRRLDQQDRSIPTLVTEYNEFISTSTAKAEALNNRFAKNANDIDFGEYTPPVADEDDLSDYSTTPAFVEREIRRSKKRCAPGDDGITTTILKNIAHSIAGPLSLLLNRSMAEGTFPSSWKVAKIIAIPKSGGDKSSIDSYRPISLLSTISKIFERHIETHLRRHLRISSNQFGFIRRRGTSSALIAASQFLHDHLDNCKFGKVVGIFLDVKKAFDKVPFAGLLRTLEYHHGVPPKLLQILHSYLSNRSHFTVVGSARSNAAPVKSGVPQGSILGPLLFVSYIDPLLEQFGLSIRDAKIIGYADDLLLLFPVKDVSNISVQCQPGIDFVVEWLRAIGLELNPTKCQAILFRYGHNRPGRIPDISICGQKVTFVDSIKYLGITFTPDMKFTAHVEDISRRARAMLCALRRKLGKRVDRKVMGTVYSACIRSVLDNGVCAYDPVLRGDIDNLERAQLLAARMYTNDWNISVEDVRQVCGWSLLENRRKSLKLCQLWKFYHGHHDYANVRFIHPVDVGLRRSSRLGAPHHLLLPRHSNESFKQSFEFSSISIWNALPEDIVLSSFDAFKTHVDLIERF